MLLLLLLTQARYTVRYSDSAHADTMDAGRYDNDGAALLGRLQTM